MDSTDGFRVAYKDWRLKNTKALLHITHSNHVLQKQLKIFLFFTIPNSFFLISNWNMEYQNNDKNEMHFLGCIIFLKK